MSHNRLWMAFLSVLVGSALLGASWSVAADVYEPFESPQTSWRLIDYDCPAMRVVKHERRFHEARAGNGCEYLEVVADLGTYVRMGSAIPRAAAIDELSINVWVRSSRPGIQLLARAVLPKSTRKVDGKPVTTWLRGDVYEQVGEWQLLSLTGVAHQLRRQEASLRFEHGSHLTLTGAYVDLVGLNVYGGPGRTQVWIDELRVTGAVALSVAAEETDAQLDNHSIGFMPLRRSADLLVGAAPCFVRAIEYRGEPCSMLAQLGFNAIWLPQAAPEKLIDEAHRHHLWVLAPEDASGTKPPDMLLPSRTEAAREGAAPDGFLTGAGMEDVPEAAVHAPRRALRAEWVHDRDTPAGDVALVELATLSSGYALERLPERLQYQRRRWPRTPMLVVLPSGPREELRRQWQALGFAPHEAWYDCEQLMTAAWSAAAGGARGILWRSQDSLDRQEPAIQLRRSQLLWINLRLQQVEAFLAGGRPAGRVDIGQPRLIGYAWETDRAGLLVLLAREPEQQLCGKALARRPVELFVPTSSSSDRAYHLSEIGLQPLLSQRVAGGITVRVEPEPVVTCVVTSREALATAHLAQTAHRLRKDLLSAKTALVAQTQSLQQATTERLDTPSREGRRRLEQATQAIAQSTELSLRDDVAGAHRFLDEALVLLAEVRRNQWERAVRAFPNTVASPLCCLYSTLPWHEQLKRRWQGHSWSSNLLPEGDMEDLAAMLAAGWRRVDLRPDQTVTVRLTDSAARSGRFSLYLAQSPGPGKADCPPADDAAVEILSAPLAVKAGQSLMVRGWARVEAAQHTAGGLVVYDSIGGLLLAEYLSPSPAWQPWVLYRTAPQDGTFTVHFRVDRCAEALVDQVTIHLLQENISHQ
ncbi:MAG: hypothetical protein KatS3mg109_0933 [Pirellulaceae bacterium]|nr:MAG: hypothetical protein KatS3mg109_0933 [Pirellulaceae bacterium]